MHPRYFLNGTVYIYIYIYMLRYDTKMSFLFGSEKLGTRTQNAFMFKVFEMRIGVVVTIFPHAPITGRFRVKCCWLY